MNAQGCECDACQNGCDSPHDSVEDRTKIRASERWTSSFLSCSACVKWALPRNTLQPATSIWPKRTFSLVMRHVTARRVTTTLAGPRSQCRLSSQESHSSCPCARGILEAVARSPPRTARKLATASFLFNCIEPNPSSERRARTITSFVARPSESFVRPHSNDSSVTENLGSIPFCAKYLSIVTVVLLTAPAVSNAARLSFSNKIPTSGTGGACTLLVRNTLF